MTVGNKLVFKVCLPVTLYVSVYSIDSLQSLGWDVVIYSMIITFLTFALGLLTAMRSSKVI